MDDFGNTIAFPQAWHGLKTFGFFGFNTAGLAGTVDLSDTFGA